MADGVRADGLAQGRLRSSRLRHLRMPEGRNHLGEASASSALFFLGRQCAGSLEVATYAKGFVPEAPTFFEGLGGDGAHSVELGDSPESASVPGSPGA